MTETNGRPGYHVGTPEPELVYAYKGETEKLHAEIKRLKAEAADWQDRYNAERQDHEATMAHCNAYHIDKRD